MFTKRLAVEEKESLAQDRVGREGSVQGCVWKKEIPEQSEKVGCWYLREVVRVDGNTGQADLQVSLRRHQDGHQQAPSGVSG